MRLPLKYSPMKSATGSEKGMHRIKASIEVTTVPTIKGNAPYCSRPAVGSHSEEQMKRKKPNSLKASMLLLIKLISIARQISSTRSPELVSRPRKILSPIGRCDALRTRVDI